MYLKKYNLKNKVALVSGAGKGLGKACALALAEAGANLIIISRTKKDLNKVSKIIRKLKSKCDSYVCDVTNYSQIKEIISKQKRIDILVNNAGTNRPAPCIDYTETDYDDVMALNVRSVYFTTRAVTRGLVAAGLEGSIINISSQMGHVGGAGRTVYCASKHALEGFTKALAWELGESGIRVNTLCPTFIETPMTEPMLEDKAFKDRVLSQIALGRLGQVEDLMGAVVYLASDASRLVTGSALMVDGGWTAV